MKEAIFYEHMENGDVKCFLCPHGCIIKPNGNGFCRIRENFDGKLFATHFGKVTSISLDPIEKKPLYHFCSGAQILSIGGYSCNFRCPFCQNFSISMEQTEEESLPPEKLLELAKNLSGRGNIGVAYTYNEPFINYEYMYETARLIKAADMKNVIVTNGYVSKEPLIEMLPYIDAMNIDLKAYNDSFYDMIRGDISTVLDTIETAAGKCHIELTTLIIPDENDDETEIEEMVKWISGIDKSIPLHLNRFFPQYKMKNKKPTPIDKLKKLEFIANKHLDNVHVGNV